MRRDPSYILRRTADTIVIVPVGQAAVDFPGMIAVNDTGELLWELLAQEQTEPQLVQALCRKFDADPARVAADLSAFLRRLRLAGALVEDGST